MYNRIAGVFQEIRENINDLKIKFIVTNQAYIVFLETHKNTA